MIGLFYVAEVESNPSDDLFTAFVGWLGYGLLMAYAFRITLLTFVEQKICCMEKALVRVREMDTDGFLGNTKNANTEIKYCYPKEVKAERNKLICRDENGKRVKVRLIGSERKMDKIRRTFLCDGPSVYITYGKLTRIVFRFETTAPRNSELYETVRMIDRMF